MANTPQNSIHSTLWSGTSMEDSTLFSSSKWNPLQGHLLVCGGQSSSSILNGDSALQAVAPDGLVYPAQKGPSSDSDGKTVDFKLYDHGFWNHRSGSSCETAP
ncbi:hypothetical protein AVEN_95433-1 [Araneus ventricosus]|uniref:Uncharacterized protein n=1 Tax=Araneus ventricosus TaxID=182803 RepID=A0A4Y2CIH3_ARAVE|nr:hypothetical protein AVEN_95433-1 [Araneus ventricosus]